MAITVYELDGIDDVRFSPFCWRTLLALKHKGFHDFERVPVSFRDRSPIAFSNQERIPVLVDGDTRVSDSWDIACYLEHTYPDRPTLFGGGMGRAEALFINAWAQQIQNRAGLDERNDRLGIGSMFGTKRRLAAIEASLETIGETLLAIQNLLQEQALTTAHATDDMDVA